MVFDIDTCLIVELTKSYNYNNSKVVYVIIKHVTGRSHPPSPNAVA